MIVDSLSFNCSERTLHNVWIVDSFSSSRSEFTLYVCNVWIVDSPSSNCSEFTLHVCNIWIVNSLVTVMYSVWQCCQA